MMIEANSGLTLASLALLAFCVASETGQQLCFKAGTNRIPGNRGAVRGALAQPLIWAGVAIWVVEVFAWILVLQRMPLSVAYPVMALVYVGVPVCSVLFLNEKMTLTQFGGAGLIAVGVLCVALSGSVA